MKIQRNTHMLHPILTQCIRTIQSSVIDAHNAPMRVFETGREHDRHEILINKGKTKNIISNHLYDLENDPPLYATAMDYVYYDGKWSWNLRNSTTDSWYRLFGNLVLDICPELQWSGMNRKAVNYCHFEVKRETLISMLGEIPCVI